MTEFLRRGAKGMKSIKDLPILQDVPPAGGFPAIRIDRRLPSTGPTGVTIFAVGTAVMAYGYYRMYGMIQDRKMDNYNLQMTRAPIVPVLQAEEDLKAYAILQKEAEEEQRYLSEVPGWQAGEPVSATGRYIPPPTPAGIWDPSVQ